MKGGRVFYDETAKKYIATITGIGAAGTGMSNTDKYNQAEADMLNFLMEHTDIGRYLTDNTNESFYKNFPLVLLIYSQLNFANKKKFIAYLEEIVFYRCKDITYHIQHPGHSNQLQIMCNVLRTIGVTPTLSRDINPTIPNVPLNLKLQQERLASQANEDKLQSKQADLETKLQTKRADIEALKEKMKAAENKAESVPLETYNLPKEIYDRIMSENYNAPLQFILDEAAYFYHGENIEDPDELISNLNKTLRKKGGTKRKRKRRSKRRNSLRRIK